MAKYQVEEIVTLSAARGGWQGVITQLKTVGAKQAYRVYSLNPTDFDEVGKIVLEDDIASSQGFGSYPSWEVGDTVTLMKLSGTIEAINGTEYTVKIEDPQKHYTQRRLHTVPRWRLLIENNR